MEVTRKRKEEACPLKCHQSTTLVVADVQQAEPLEETAQDCDRDSEGEDPQPPEDHDSEGEEAMRRIS